jgi:hypothetical protein
MSVTPISDQSNWSAQPASAASAAAASGASVTGATAAPGSGATAGSSPTTPITDDALIEALTDGSSTSALLSSLSNPSYTSSGSLAETAAESELWQGIDTLA